jgi:hypothetical protein
VKMSRPISIIRDVLLVETREKDEVQCLLVLVFGDLQERRLEDCFPSLHERKRMRRYSGFA